MSKYGLIAKLVWDGTDEVRIPSELGTPAPNQMRGTAFERLSELSGRACYDSLGRGRSSEDYHQHIKEVRHTSVYGHATATIEFRDVGDTALLAYLNRPGVWVNISEDGKSHRVTLNPRALMDWDYWSGLYTNQAQKLMALLIEGHLIYHFGKLCPMIIRGEELSPYAISETEKISRIVEPETDEEKWISLFLSGSRGNSHEQVRHGFRTGISQRSTRFVDENESPWIQHPLIREYLDDQMKHEDSVRQFALRKAGETDQLISDARKVYASWVETLQPWLVQRGADKTTARKQARGAARGYLGNALQTEMIFSASVLQWKRILRQRLSDPADAEIRNGMAEALPELQKSRYGDSFKNFKLINAKDGIGQSSIEEAS